MPCTADPDGKIRTPAAALNTYFYFKEEEIRKIITTVEGIRYSLSTPEILSCLAES